MILTEWVEMVNRLYWVWEHGGASSSLSSQRFPRPVSGVAEQYTGQEHRVGEETLKRAWTCELGPREVRMWSRV